MPNIARRLAARGVSALSLLLAFTAPAAASTVQSFNNTGQITINAVGNATPYPSNITVSGVPNTFTRLEVQLNSFSHTYPDDVDILLVGPQGQRTILMSDAGGIGPGVTGLTLSFAQTAANPIADVTALSSGLFRPANYDPGTSDTFSTPGPGAITDAPADLSVFTGINPNGSWNLLVVDDAIGDLGNISGGWRLSFTVPTVFTVTKTADSNDGACNADCSLREALALAQDGDLVNFSALFNTPQTIRLLTALPDITRSITIQGTGANLLTVQRDFNAATDFRIFNFPSGVSNGVAISGMTITGGNPGGVTFGGGIRSQSHLTLTNVHLIGNTAGTGGGVVLAFANGIFTNCTFSNNLSTNAAGGGGGINFQGSSSTLRLVSSTVSGNRAANAGGGIQHANQGGGISRLEITNSTIANNTAASASGIRTLTQITAGNIATTTLRNTIVANNAPGNLLALAVGGIGTPTFETLGFNLSNDNFAGGGFTPIPGSDISSATPRLAPLALYGGGTPTHALLHSSPAINAGNATGATTDQRGVPRVFGAAADIGAVEMRSRVVNATNDSGPFSLRDAVNNANADAQIDDILFDQAAFGTQVNAIFLNTELFLSNPANIIGPGANLLTISGSNLTRALQIGPNVSATVSGVTVTGGNADGDGGGIFNDGVLTVTHSIVSNSVSPFNGGGIGSGNGDRLTVSHSTLAGNRAIVGGGINNNGVLTVQNSTISGNTSQIDGGGIHSQDGSVSVTSATITNNVVNSGLSGVSVFTGTGVFRNSIIAGNANNASNPDVGGTGVTSNGFNLIGNRGTLTFAATGDQAGTAAAPLNPLLGVLQNNGGTTNTHALLPGSPALDRGNSSGATSDQRGSARPVDLQGVTNTSDGSDIGAFEAQPAGVAPTVALSPSSLTFPSGPAGTATSSVNVSSSGGVAPGTVTVSTCVATSGFTITNAPISLTGTAGGSQINANINLSCTRGPSMQSGSLSCTETSSPGSAITRNLTLNCPAVAVDLIFSNGFE